jgi:hypothetical protein
VAGESRVHIRLPAGVKEWAKVYAQERGITLSALVVRLIQELKEQDDVTKLPADAEQI